MKRIEKALKMMEEFNYQATIVDNKLYVTAWNTEQSDSADFQVSKEDIDKWAAHYDRERTKQLLVEMREDLNKIYETIEETNNGDVYEIEMRGYPPMKTLLSNIDCQLDELNNLEGR